MSIKKNYLYNLIYQFLIMLIPLITTPHLSRVFGPDGIGSISFSESIVSYFSLFAVLGISQFGQREISYYQDDRSKRTIVFWNIKVLEIITSSFVIVCYLVFVYFQTNRLLFLVLVLNLFSILVDISWLFQGMEDFGKLILRSTIVRIATVIYIFLWIKTKDDLIKYVFIQGILNLIGGLSLWLSLPSIVDKPHFCEIHPFYKIKEVFSLFFPTIAIQIYTVLDKTMIGVITRNSFENGYYEQSIKVSKMALTIVTALGTVMIPRIGYHFKKGEEEKVKYYLYRAYRFVWFLAIPMCFGLIGISSNFVPWFFGDGFNAVTSLLCILSFIIPIIGISNVTGLQYFVPIGKQHYLSISVLVGACTNFILNVFLIKYYQSIGAAIASVIAEFFVTSSQLYLVRKEISILMILKSSFHYLISSCLMLISLFILSEQLKPSIINTFLLITIGSIVYFACLIIIKDEFFIDNFKIVFKKIKKSERSSR